MKYKISYKALDNDFDFQAFEKKIENFYNSLKWVENLQVKYYNITGKAFAKNTSLVVRYHNNTLYNYLDKEFMIEIKPFKKEIIKSNYPYLTPYPFEKEELKFFDFLDFQLTRVNEDQDITDWVSM
jgi:hypothetical protein